jgi:selenide,water dikinase
MSPKDTAQVVRRLPKFSDPNLLVGMETLDDAGVYRLTDELAIVQTVDIFTPPVDDPYDYGRIVGANSLSDVYAMGGKPLTVLNILGFPAKHMKSDLVPEILRGGAEKIKEAGALLVGGHSMIDPEPKYGMAVTGVVHPQRIITNSNARVGDQIILTKPLGIGILTIANIKQALPDELMRRMIDSMVTLNKTASEVMLKVGVNACTDITGFGLLGHGSEMAEMSQVTIRIFTAQVPFFKEALEFARQLIMPGGSFSNKDFYGPRVEASSDIPQEIHDICFDAQTSGGLLMSVPQAQADKMLKELHKQGVKDAAIIGEVITRQAHAILLD